MIVLAFNGMMTAWTTNDNKVHWENNRTRLNQDNMNAISSALTNIVSILNGDDKLPVGLLSTIDDHQLKLFGNIDDTNKNLGLTHQISQLRKVVLDKDIEENSDYNFAADFFPIKDLHVVSTEPESTGWLATNGQTKDINKDIKIDIGNRSLLRGAPITEGSAIVGYTPGILKSLADSIVYNYKQIHDIGSVYKPHSIAFCDGSVISDTASGVVINNCVDLKDSSGNYMQGENPSSVVVYQTLRDTASDITNAYIAQDAIIMKALNNLADKEVTTPPTASLKISVNGSTDTESNINVEVGTQLNASAVATFNSGYYEYAMDDDGYVTSTNTVPTSVTVKSNGYKFDWTHSRLGSKSETNATGTSSSNYTGYVEDSDKLTCKVTISHSAGSVPYNDLGFAYADGQIKEGTKQKTLYFNSYRKSFYGTLTSKQSELNSSTIRGLKSSSTSALANGSTFTISIPVGAIRVVFAYPATLRDVTKVEDVNAWNTDIKGSFTKVVGNVNVDDASGANPIAYKVYYIDFANPNDKANSYNVTI